MFFDMRLRIRLFDNVFEFVEPAAAGGFLRLSIHLEIVSSADSRNSACLAASLRLVIQWEMAASKPTTIWVPASNSPAERKFLLVGNETCQLGQQVVLALGGAGDSPLEPELSPPPAILPHISMTRFFMRCSP